MGILAASSMSFIQRLNHTKSSLPKASISKLENMQKLMAPQKSWAEFRAVLDSSVPPAIPYLGVFLTDLTFINDGNKDMIDGKINWKKIILIHKVLETVRKFQKVPYCFSIQNPAYTLLHQLHSLDDENNYQLSLVREPKNIDRKVLLAK